MTEVCFLAGASSMLNVQLTLFAIMLIGVIVSKKKMIDGKTRKAMSDLLINVILPASIITSFNQEFTMETMKKSILVLVVCFGIQFLSVFFSKILYRKVPHAQQVVLKYATVCSNAGFLGLTVIGGIYGQDGLFYGAIALIPSRIFIWTAGVSLFTNATNKKEAFKKVAAHPCMIAVYIGFVYMLSGITLPVFLDKTLNAVGGCTTAVSMMVIGAIIADTDIRTVISKLILFYSSVRLIILPLVTLIILKLLKIDSLITGIAVLIAAMPAGSFTAILADKYNGDAEFASKCVFTSTVLSMVTIPIISLLL